jgi:glycosyltransferase involved in cell wall biosynthesis
MLSYPMAAWWTAARVLRGRSYDVVHSHFAVPTGPGSVPPSNLARLPHVLSLHGGDIYDPSKRFSPHRHAFLRLVVDGVLRSSAAVVAQSTNTRENTYRYYGYRGPIEIIPLGIRQPQYRPATREELGLPGDAFLTVTVGRLVKRKALDQLLRVLARPECARAHLVVVGSGPELDPLRSLAERLSLGTRARFLGRVEEERKWQILAAADAYVSATLHEGFGLVYLEAMAAGLPVITPDHGGQVDFLVDGESGYLVPAGDEARLAAAIARAESEPAERRRMGESNRKRAPEHRIERCAEAYETLFDRLLAERRVISR